jgi:hypothetical protein
LRVLLKKENISIDSLKVSPHFQTLFLFIEEAQIIEGRQFLNVLGGIESLGFFEVLEVGVYIAKKSVPHSDIIYFCNFSLVGVILHFRFWRSLSLKHLVPFLFELFSTHELLVFFDACIKKEHGRVSCSKFEVDFAHIPLECLLVKIRKISGNQFHEPLADFLELLDVVIAVELKGAVHDPAVVQRGNSETVRRRNMRSL